MTKTGATMMTTPPDTPHNADEGNSIGNSDISPEDFVKLLAEAMSTSTPEPRLVMKPLIEDIADQIVNHRNDHRLRWESYYRVFVYPSKILPKDKVPNKTRKYRHQRFRRLLRKRLKREGWIAAGRDIYLCVK